MAAQEATRGLEATEAPDAGPVPGNSASSILQNQPDLFLSLLPCQGENCANAQKNSAVGAVFSYPIDASEKQKQG